MASVRSDIPMESEQASPLTVNDFRMRAKDAQVETVTLDTGDGKRVVIHSDDYFDPSTDTVLASVGDLPGASVRAVGVIAGGKHLECDFVALHASGFTNAQFDILTMLRNGLPLLWPLDEEDITEIQEIERLTSTSRAQRSLFDHDTDP